MRGRGRRIVKRLLDVAMSLFLVGALWPVLLLVGLSVWLFLGRPILFRQLRPGYAGCPFNILKFRTMSDARDAEGNLRPDSERLTWFGRFLRSTSLDELPELFNVIKGDMSLVGPRPLLMEYLNRYSPEQARRHEVRPGITGWAQIQGRNAISWEEKFALDLWYVEHQSIRLDLRILAITAWKLVTQEGINQPGHPTVEEFAGSVPHCDPTVRS